MTGAAGGADTVSEARAGAEGTVGADAGTVAGSGLGAALAGAVAAVDCRINSLIRSTIGGSRLAKAFALTSSPHF